MATKYFCDICKKEIDFDNKIYLSGFGKTKIREVCANCWQIAEFTLLKLAKTLALKADS